MRAAGRAALDILPAGTSRWIRMHRRDSAVRVVGLAQVDEMVEEAARRFAESEDAGRAYLGGLRLAAPPAPVDPFSAEYRAWTWDLYRRVSGREGYSTDHEASSFDLDAALVRPYPYATGSAGVVGDDLVRRGTVVKALGLAAPARVVEFGPGWGNLTCDLVAMGHDVTAVEVDRGFCELVERRTPAARVVCADMLGFAAAPTGEPYDAAVFYESFHHCADHLMMLERLHDVVGPNGVVVMGAEPIDLLAYPWGPRLDGLSVWSMRRYGWLELGFDERYFALALERSGWGLTSVQGPAPGATAYVARTCRR